MDREYYDGPHVVKKDIGEEIAPHFIQQHCDNLILSLYLPTSLKEDEYKVSSYINITLKGVDQRSSKKDIIGAIKDLVEKIETL